MAVEFHNCMDYSAGSGGKRGQQQRHSLTTVLYTRIKEKEKKTLLLIVVFGLLHCTATCTFQKKRKELTTLPLPLYSSVALPVCIKGKKREVTTFLSGYCIAGGRRLNLHGPAGRSGPSRFLGL